MHSPYYNRRHRYYNPYLGPQEIVLFNADSFDSDIKNDSCGCKKSGTGDLKSAIGENPLVFAVGALVVGYLLAKKR